MVKGESRNLGGRPPGSLNKITRTLKDALIAAAVELGQLPLSQWEAELEKPHHQNECAAFCRPDSLQVTGDG
jgi:hypothetical protein